MAGKKTAVCFFFWPNWSMKIRITYKRLFGNVPGIWNWLPDRINLRRKGFTLLKKLDKFSQKQSAIVPNLPEMPGLALLYLGM